MIESADEKRLISRQVRNDMLVTPGQAGLALELSKKLVPGVLPGDIHYGHSDISTVIVSFEMLRAALANPVRVLKNE